MRVVKGIVMTSQTLLTQTAASDADADVDAAVLENHRLCMCIQYTIL